MSSSPTLFRNLILFALVVFVLGGIFFIPREPQTFIVTRTVEVFKPATVTIRVGDTVTFTSAVGEPFWPASDFHPSHQIYPEFDSKHGLMSGERWSFVFERAGTWTYHDHLAREVRGSVIVIGASKEDIATCVANSTATVKSYCWAGLFTTIVRERGLEAALDRFANLYAGDSAFQGNCHDIMHILGKAGYDEFEKTDTPVMRSETSHCAYGFYHGFIEEMFAVNGSTDLGEGARYCEMIRTSSAFPSPSAALNAAAACFHGLGHASFDSLDGSLFGDDERMVAAALSQCETFVPESDQAQCASGVFNSLANAYSGHDYELEFHDPDPTSICRPQKSAYQWSCYGEVTIGYVRNKKYDFVSAALFIESLPAERLKVIFDYIDDYIRHDMADPSPGEVKLLCEGFADPDEVRSCVRGVIHALVAGGEPGKEETKGIRYCGLFSDGDPLRRLCFETVGRELIAVKSDALRKKICSSLAPEDAEACMEIVQ